jgi:hypothetical protein
MDAFIKSNPGLQRRFATEIVSRTIHQRNCWQFSKSVQRVQCSLSLDLINALKNLFTQLDENRDQNFGNAGLVENMFNEIDDLRSTRVIEQNLDSLREPFQVDDLPPKYRDLALKGQKIRKI